MFRLRAENYSTCDQGPRESPRTESWERMCFHSHSAQGQHVAMAGCCAAAGACLEARETHEQRDSDSKVASQTFSDKLHKTHAFRCVFCRSFRLVPALSGVTGEVASIQDGWTARQRALKMTQ